MLQPTYKNQEAQAVRVIQSDTLTALYSFTDYISAYDDTKRATIVNKGKYCAGISAQIFSFLESKGIFTSYLSQPAASQILCHTYPPIPLIFLVRNVAAGTIVDTLGIRKGERLEVPIVELYYNNEQFASPFINDAQALALHLLTQEQLSQIYHQVERINTLLSLALLQRDILLVDLTLQFAWTEQGPCLVEFIYPDNSRFWDSHTLEPLDKDRFSEDRGNVGDSYRKIYHRLLTL